MTLYKHIEIDLDTTRSRVLAKDYLSGRQRKSLLRLYSLFEQGRFQEAIRLSKSWRKDSEGWSLRDTVDEQVWQVLWDVTMGDTYTIKP